MAKLTPMMAQYKEIKAEFEDCILMFRLGDFYEMFFEDAVEAAKILQITLTARGKKEGSKVPMCGVPFHALDSYLWKLTRAGKKVAICDQVTAPDGKGIVEREVKRVVTPGTTFDENILENKANNYVVSLARAGKSYGLAYGDVTTGDFKVTEVSGLSELIAELKKINPAECIASEEILAESFWQELKGIHCFPYVFNGDAAARLLGNFEIKSLNVFGIEGKELATLASAMLLEYFKETQKTDLAHIQKISFYQTADFMPLNETVIRNLELFFNSHDGKKEGSLIWVLDNTMTAMGGRLLRNWLMQPLLDRGKIVERHDKVEAFLKDSTLLREVREVMSRLFDVERLLSRLSLGSGNARDLLAMKQSLSVVPEIKKLVAGIDLAAGLNDFSELVGLIERAICEEAPVSVRDGGMIAAGYNKELDDLKAISSEGKTFIQNLVEREIERTGISSLKVKFNKVFGYYIEISKSNLAQVPEDYIRKQTLVNAERFITPELKEYEEKVLSAEDKIKELEYELFYGVRMEVVKEILKIQETAKALARIDVLSNFAFNAVKNNYVRPEIGEVTEITDGRHAVIEKISRDFVPNDCAFADGDFLLVTGPNMGGKSTYLRQVALVVLMNQIGSFVAAGGAKLEICDRMFTRVGASDNLVRGESTFMVEMQEASYILNHATEKSLVILDEIGRGTSTYDGLSLAWAIMEYLHDKVGCKTLFATHYHELIELAAGLPGAKNLSVAVRENQEEGVVFLYKIIEGGIDQSYGIEVAKLAGLPVDVIGRARGVMDQLEKKHIAKSAVSPGQRELFEREPQGLNKGQQDILDELKDIDVNKITPIEAMQKLNEMHKKSNI